jgi:hypothetical protein
MGQSSFETFMAARDNRVPDQPTGNCPYHQKRFDKRFDGFRHDTLSFIVATFCTEPAENLGRSASAT